MTLDRDTRALVNPYLAERTNCARFLSCELIKVGPTVLYVSVTRKRGEEEEERKEVREVRVEEDGRVRGRGLLVEGEEWRNGVRVYRNHRDDGGGRGGEREEGREEWQEGEEREALGFGEILEVEEMMKEVGEDGKEERGGMQGGRWREERSEMSTFLVE
ncbi:uncharacterized protein A4U43_C02F20970 [Asparagus officinalis]|uniref:Uncharacterized protein n=1 Tax=Asparagus officinalis TaxID=4686 RepID=A0A5P1FJV3_ASPOF|nr:uncharacterized protein A4U43_C02F20970 [Asparagus officinalis]